MLKLNFESLPIMESATQLLLEWQQGDSRALAALIPLVHSELHKRARSLMRGERADHTLQPTALVNEVYLKLIDQKRVSFNGRTHFYRIASHRMRQILVDHARAHAAEKRGGGLYKVTLDDAGEIAVAGKSVDILDLDEALEALELLKPAYRELVEMRFFGGLTIEETAEAMGVSGMTVKRQWRFVRAWLRERLSIGDEAVEGEAGET